MTDTVIKPEEISDALFSCVYSWVNGHAIDKKGADAAVARHRDSTSPYGVLARRLCEFVAGSGPTYEELCDLGLVLTDASRQKENRIALVAEVIGDEWISPYISIHFLSLNPLLVRRRRYSRGERYPSALCGCHSL